MSSAKITSKGQITIPQEVRKAMGVSEGDRVDFVRLDNGSFALYPKTGSIQDLKGIIPPPKRAVTLEEMQEAIIAGATKGYKTRATKK
ncbi:MAG: AbrB/MazE/SpoVT family DNA-binding domain-containing protein [Pseudomonadota bacterium]